MEKKLKKDIIAEYQIKEGDTGSPEVQIALLTNRISYLTTHLKEHKKELPIRWQRGVEALLAGVLLSFV